MFKVGDEVFYGIHGKCVITAIETKNVGSLNINFYQMKALKNPIAPKAIPKNSPCILVPVENATHNGLRNLMTNTDVEQVLNTLAEQNYHFELNEPWGTKQKKLEDTLRKEGPIGLAKVVGHLHYIIKNDAAPRSDIVRFYESIFRNMIREIADAIDIPSKEAESRVLKALRNKLQIDN